MVAARRASRRRPSLESRRPSRYGAEGGGTRDVPSMGGMESLPEEEGGEGKTVVINFVRSAVDAGGRAPARKELSSNGGSIGARKEPESGPAIGVSKVVVKQRAGCWAFIGFVGPYFFPGLEELLLNLSRVSQ